MGDLNIHDVHDVEARVENAQMKLEHIFMTYMLAHFELKCVTSSYGNGMATRIPEGGRRFQRPSTLDYIIVEDNKDTSPLIVDSDRFRLHNCGGQ